MFDVLVAALPRWASLRFFAANKSAFISGSPPPAFASGGEKTQQV
jgi:hypothetical protein